MPAQDQLPLPFPRAPKQQAAEFVRAPSNDAALTWLDRIDDWPQRRLAIWGDPGTGKTHLLRSWAAATGAQYVTGSTLPSLDELPDLPTTCGLAIDDAEAMADETTLLHLLNAAAEARLPLLMSARTAPARWPVRLGDLASRLRAMTAVQILPPDDMLLRLLLARVLAERQLRVPEATQTWLLAHLPRTQAALLDAVNRLDHAALGRPGGITRPLARDELADMIGTDLEDAGEGGAGEGGAGGPVRTETATFSQSPTRTESTLSSTLLSPPAPRLL
jgi:chromosomal replication initiation ATPase DnaA